MNVVLTFAATGSCILEGELLAFVISDSADAGVVKNVELCEVSGRCWTKVKFDAGGELSEMVQLPYLVLKLAVAFRSAGKSEKASLDSVGNELQCLWDVWEDVEVTFLLRLPLSGRLLLLLLSRSTFAPVSTSLTFFLGL